MISPAAQAMIDQEGARVRELDCGAIARRLSDPLIMRAVFEIVADIIEAGIEPGKRAARASAWMEYIQAACE